MYFKTTYEFDYFKEKQGLIALNIRITGMFQIFTMVIQE